MSHNSSNATPSTAMASSINSSSPGDGGAVETHSLRSTAASSGGPSLRSCVPCRRRKVRCDKVHPCANCVRLGAACVFPPPGRARPRPRHHQVPNRSTHSTSAPMDRSTQTPDQTTAFVSNSRASNSQTHDSSQIDAQIESKEKCIERFFFLGQTLPKWLAHVDTRSVDWSSNVDEEGICTLRSPLDELSGLVSAGSGLTLWFNSLVCLSFKTDRFRFTGSREIIQRER